MLLRSLAARIDNRRVSPARGNWRRLRGQPPGIRHDMRITIVDFNGLKEHVHVKQGFR
jgi:hypothetical protein